MRDKEKNIIYTARDIQQYLEGNLSSEQMHAMEKAALDDAFLAEAMEGYDTVKEQEWNNHLVTLREAIGSKGTRAKVIPLHKPKNKWWKAAAAVFLIGTAALFSILVNKKAEKTDTTTIAQSRRAVSDSLVLPVQPPAASVTENLNPSASATIEQKESIPGSLAKLIKPVSDDERLIADPTAPRLKPATAGAVVSAGNDVAMEVTAPLNYIPAAVPGNADVAKDVNTENNKAAARQLDEVAIQSRQRSLADTKKDAVLNNFFTAQVIAPDNTPLPFTNIAIKKENFGTYADVKGMVRLVSTDSILQVEVNAVGYQPKTYALRSNQATARIILQEDETAFKDRVVVGNAEMAAGKRSRRAIMLKDTVVNAEPADGWDNYNTYVANNLDIPAAALQSNVHGEVQLSFNVQSNGTISDIKVNKSLGTAYDEAVRRLILEGPQWKVKKGKKTTATVKVQF